MCVCVGACVHGGIRNVCICRHVQGMCDCVSACARKRMANVCRCECLRAWRYQEFEYVWTGVRNMCMCGCVCVGACMRRGMRNVCTCEHT